MDSANTKLVVEATSLERSKSYFLIDHLQPSFCTANRTNLVKIGPVYVEIIVLKGIVKNKKEQQNI